MSAQEELASTAKHFSSRPDATVVGVTLGTIREARDALELQDELAEALRAAIAVMECNDPRQSCLAAMRAALAKAEAREYAMPAGMVTIKSLKVAEAN